jgi:hypothetical protein
LERPERRGRWKEHCGVEGDKAVWQETTAEDEDEYDVTHHEGPVIGAGSDSYASSHPESTGKAQNEPCGTGRVEVGYDHPVLYPGDGARAHSTCRGKSPNRQPQCACNSEHGDKSLHPHTPNSPQRTVAKHSQSHASGYLPAAGNGRAGFSTSPGATYHSNTLADSVLGTTTAPRTLGTSSANPRCQVLAAVRRSLLSQRRLRLGGRPPRLLPSAQRGGPRVKVLPDRATKSITYPVAGDRRSRMCVTGPRRPPRRSAARPAPRRRPRG